LHRLLPLANMGKSNKIKRKKAQEAAAKKAGQRAEKREMRRQKGKNKGNEWKRDFDKFCDQLRPFGLRIKDVQGDGNCLFRSVADQLEGDQNKHDKYRSKCLEFMETNPDDFKPFVFDEEYPDYLKRMRKDGEWGGNLELAGISQAFDVHITIHQLAQPRWEVRNPKNAFSRMIHLSYHDGQHYCSVRNLRDRPSEGASEIKAFENSGGAKRGKGSGGAEGESKDKKTLRILRESTGCRNTKFMGQALADNGGDVEATIEYLIAMREADLAEFFVEDDEGGDASDGVRGGHDDAEKKEAKGKPHRKTNRNGPCPCGSKKKYKVCCAKKDKLDKENAKRAARKDKSVSPSRRGGGGKKGKGARVQNLTNKQRKELARKAKQESKSGEKASGKSGKGKKKEEPADDDPPVDLGSLCI